jgi:hypothetical protein
MKSQAGDNAENGLFAQAKAVFMPLALFLLPALASAQWSVSKSSQPLPDSPSYVVANRAANTGTETFSPDPVLVTREAPCTLRSPDAPQSTEDQAHANFEPVSSHCKFKLFLKQIYSPYTFVSVAYEATWAQAWAQWPQYGGGMEGWGKRLGATLADTESRRFIQGYVLSSALHQDPRYFFSGRKKLIERAWYAGTRVFITRSDRGVNELNTSELFGTLSTSTLQNAYYPRPYRTFG